VKAAEQKNKKRKRRAASPLVVVTLSIPTPRSGEVESEEEEEKEKDEAIEELLVTKDRPARRSESVAAKRQRELVQRRRRMPFDVVWRRSVQLPQRRQGCTQ
jgi:hypothetical protein